jgi:hypothetical protein
MAGTYAVSSVALLVALLLLIFKHECAFTAEIIVMLNVIWGGLYHVMLPHMGGGEEERKKKWGGYLGLKGVLIVFSFALVPVSAWFWLRMASVGEADFVATPGGTSFFLFTRVRDEGLEIGSRFMAILSIWTSSTPVMAFLVIILHDIKQIGLGRDVEVLLLITPAAFFTAVIGVYVIILMYVLVRVGSIISSSMGRFEGWARFWEHSNETGVGYR